MESFFPTLNVEEVWQEAYEDFAQGQRGIDGYIAKYNALRIQSSLGNMSPERFEARFRKDSTN